MLVIRRREGEALLVDGRIEITVLEITPSRVKIGVSAPPEVPVLRKEVLLTEQENREAAQFPSASLRTSPVWLPPEKP